MIAIRIYVLPLSPNFGSYFSLVNLKFQILPMPVIFIVFRSAYFVNQIIVCSKTQPALLYDYFQ
jgi:hypothetical protein